MLRICSDCCCNNVFITYVINTHTHARKERLNLILQQFILANNIIFVKNSRTMASLLFKLANEQQFTRPLSGLISKLSCKD